MKITEKNFGLHIPEGGENSSAEDNLISKMKELVSSYTINMEALSYRKALSSLKAIWAEGNNYIASTEPWKVVKEDKTRAAVILRMAFNLMRVYAILSRPIIPFSSTKLLEALGISSNNCGWISADDMVQELKFFKGGETFTLIEPLFAQISNERVEELKATYGSEDI